MDITNKGKRSVLFLLFSNLQLLKELAEQQHYIPSPREETITPLQEAISLIMITFKTFPEIIC